MDINVLIAAVYAAFWVAPLILAIAGTHVYDYFQRRKSRVDGKYRCKRCGLVFPMKGASISGYESHRYGLHIHCRQCGAVVAQFVKVKNGQATPAYLDAIRGSMLKPKGGRVVLVENRAISMLKIRVTFN